MSECLSYACCLIIQISYLDLCSCYGWPKVYGYFSYSSVLLPSELFKALDITRTKNLHLVCLFSFTAKKSDISLSVCVFNFFLWGVLRYSYSYFTFHELWPAVLQDIVKIDYEVPKSTCGFYLCYLYFCFRGKTLIWLDNLKCLSEVVLLFLSF